MWEINKLTDKAIYPDSWKSIVEKHADSMSNDNPENHWWIASNMEDLAESLWEDIMEVTNK
tara:strand:+ start:401 stop:583 length:183 start_codon:yes stop_codon:yes gene_type:complete